MTVVTVETNIVYLVSTATEFYSNGDAGTSFGNFIADQRTVGVNFLAVKLLGFSPNFGSHSL